jgi:mannose-6-phosphate isomerase-like protein (cupin superfamily)
MEAATAPRVVAKESHTGHENRLHARLKGDAFVPTFNKDIVALTEQNDLFRQEILTNEHTQLVLMSVQPGDDIGEEVHHVDQVLVFVSGSGDAVLNGQRSAVRANSLVVVPAGTTHNFINTGNEPLKLFTIYGPPEEAPGTVHRTKAEAEAAEKK